MGHCDRHAKTCKLGVDRRRDTTRNRGINQAVQSHAHIRISVHSLGIEASTRHCKAMHIDCNLHASIQIPYKRKDKRMLIFAISECGHTARPDIRGCRYGLKGCDLEVRQTDDGDRPLRHDPERPQLRHPSRYPPAHLDFGDGVVQVAQKRQGNPMPDRCTMAQVQ